LNSVRDWTNEAGDVINHVVYDAFGNVTSQTGASFESLIGYTGRPFDAETGLQNNLNRWYDATNGRWISEDPISFAAGDSNLYRYVGNGSLTATDPTGLQQDISDFGRGFADGLGIGGQQFVADTGELLQAAGDFTAYVGVATAGGAVHIGETFASLFGHEPSSLALDLKHLAQRIGSNSKAISATNSALNLLKQLSPSELASLAQELPAALAESLGDLATEWFERYQHLYEHGCYEQAGRMVGELVGVLLPELLAGGALAAAKGGGKISAKGLAKAIKNFLKDERGSLDLDKIRDLLRKGGRNADELGDSLKNRNVDDLGDLLREGRIKKKDLEKAGLSPVERKSKQSRPRNRGTDRIIDEIGDTKGRLNNALDKVTQNPNDLDALKELAEAQQKFDEMTAAQRDILNKTRQLDN